VKSTSFAVALTSLFKIKQEEGRTGEILVGQAQPTRDVDSPTALRAVERRHGWFSFLLLALLRRQFQPAKAAGKALQ
jgi:hypothetical protein